MESCKVRITKAKESTYWYANKIGHVFDAVGVSNMYQFGDSFVITIDGDSSYLVSWNDCTFFIDE